jgi:uncharacterized protein (TIGR03437 family)
VRLGPLRLQLEALVKLRILLLILTLWSAVASAASPVYVGAPFGLYKSSDAGVSWQQVSVPLDSPFFANKYVAPRSIAVDPGNPNRIYFVGLSVAYALFRSPDGGQTWANSLFVGMTPRTLAIDFAGQVLYVNASTSQSGDALLFKSIDFGVTWTRLTLPVTTQTTPGRYPFGGPAVLIKADPLVSGTIWVLNDLSEFFKSTDFGATWTKISGPGVILSSGAVGQTSILNINVDPRNSQVWFFGTDHSSFPQTCPVTNGGLCGLFKSVNGGAVFTGSSIPVNYVSSVSFGADANTVWATGTVTGLGPTVLRSTNAGDTWTPVKNNLFSSQTGRVWADPSDPNVVYTTDTICQRCLYSTTDGSNFVLRSFPTGPAGCVPGNCQQQEVLDIAFAGGPPVITSVLNGADLRPGFAPNSWVTIIGTNLASLTGDWTTAIVNGKLPTTTNGSSVSIGSKGAYVYYTSPTQLNVLAPDIAPGDVPVTVTTSFGTSAPVAAKASAYSPAFFAWPGNQVVATRQDYSFAVKAGTFTGATTLAAKPGDVIILWATGFGPTNPAPTPGFAVPADKAYASPTPVVTLNTTPVTVYGAALTSGSVGVYQVAIQLPNPFPDGDYALQATVGGAQTAPGLILAVRK